MYLKAVTICAAIIFSTMTPVTSIAAETQEGIASHGIAWEKLMNVDGKYLQDKQPTSLLTPSLKKLLGSRYAEFMGSIKVQSPMEIDNGVLIATGMMPHSGGDFSAIAFFGMNGELLAVLKSEKKVEYFGSKSLLDNPVVKGAIKTLTQ